MLIAKHVPTIEEGRHIPGAIEIRGENGIAFMCPCGCGLESYLPLGHNGWVFSGGQVTAPGEPIKPSLMPSVLNPCGWHGFMVNGAWEEI